MVRIREWRGLVWGDQKGLQGDRAALVSVAFLAGCWLKVDLVASAL
jgi:hypothetical protein